MNIFQAILLGIIQGLTEFLPISSSGHLVIAQHYLPGFQQPEILFDVLLHLGTFFAVVIFFRKDLRGIVRSFFPGDPAFQKERKVYRKLALLIIAGTVPSVIIALLFKEEINCLFHSPNLAAFMLIITGGLLALAHSVKLLCRNQENINFRDAILIGIAQAIAIVPGISRSGSTIATGMFRKIDGETAAKFSFLLSLPAISGAVVLQIGNLQEINATHFWPYLVGPLTAMLVGIFSIDILIKLIKKRGLIFFSYYCWLAGTSVLVLNFFIL